MSVDTSRGAGVVCALVGLVGGDYTVLALTGGRAPTFS